VLPFSLLEGADQDFAAARYIDIPHIASFQGTHIHADRLTGSTE